MGIKYIKEKWVKSTVPWPVMVKLEIRLQRLRRRRDLEEKNHLLEERKRDFSTRGESKMLIPTTRESKAQMPDPERNNEQQSDRVDSLSRIWRLPPLLRGLSLAAQRDQNPAEMV